MKTSDNEYHFNLFKPVTEHARRNRNLIITMVLIWFFSVFGFQFLLILLEKPTPEKAFIMYESVWENVKNGTANDAEKQDFIRSIISVYGKSGVKKEKREILRNALSPVVYGMVSDSEQVILSGFVNHLAVSKEGLVKADGEAYLDLQAKIAEAKQSIVAMVAGKAGVDPVSVEASLLPYCLNASNEPMQPETIEALPSVMKLYLIHNQSVLTDKKFLGFPFHYFYTAELLLIIFVLLCLIYSYRIEALDKKYLNTAH